MSSIDRTELRSTGDEGAPRRAAGPLHVCRPLRQRRGRGEILDAACGLLITDGLIALRLDAIAERAGTSVEAILRCWPSEEALALDVLRHEWLALASAIRRRAWD